MPNINKVILCGHVGREPELRATPSGQNVAGFSLAISRKWKDKTSGELNEETTWVDIEAWGKTAELVGEYVGKGMAVLVEGRLKLDQWEKDGEKRSKLKVVADNVQFLSRKEQDTPAAETTTEPTKVQNNDKVDDDSLPF